MQNALALNVAEQTRQRAAQCARSSSWRPAKRRNSGNAKDADEASGATQPDFRRRAAGQRKVLARAAGIHRRDHRDRSQRIEDDDRGIEI